MYRLYCEACGWNKFTDGTDISGLVPHKRSQIQGHIPKLGEDGKTETSKFLTMPKQFKCPGCGRVVTARKTNLRAEAPETPQERINEQGDPAGH